MKNYSDYDSEILMRYSEMVGTEQYMHELPFLLWNKEEVVEDVEVALEQRKSLSELFPQKYPIEVDEGEII